MNIRRSLTLTLATLSMLAGEATGQHVVPSALLTIDQNRATVIERIVGEWGDRLAMSNAGISSPQLRQILSGLRSDHLLAASLAGSVEGLRDVVSGALVRTDAAISPALMHTKSLGDTTRDLVYTPVVPCRIVDTRSGAGGVFLPGNQRNWLAYSASGFASQGGSATNCGIPVHPAAVMLNVTLADTVGGPAFFVVWPFNQTRPLAATVNWWASAQQPANAEIVPLCTGTCVSDFSAYASLQTNAIIDVLGYFNRPTNYSGTHTITGFDATDSGGFQSTASGDYSTVAGGIGNTASASYSTVGGGSTNGAAGVDSTVAGGDSNIASQVYSTVAGGEANSAYGVASTVAGGVINTASGDYSVVAGGARNTASGDYSVVAGGASNTASGDYSVVAGGASNTASGGYSFAAGQRAKATTTGSFIWADSQNFDFGPSVSNFFGVRATGGIGFTVAINPSTGAVTQFCNLLPGTPSWQCTSDRDAKENFVAADGKDILQRLVAMPLFSWSFKGADPSIRSLGPTAQDFYAAFGLGSDNKMIASINLEGVALAAIQGLHQLIKQKDTKLSAQERKITAMERELALIKEKLNMR